MIIIIILLCFLFLFFLYFKEIKNFFKNITTTILCFKNNRNNIGEDSVINSYNTMIGKNILEKIQNNNDNILSEIEEDICDISVINFRNCILISVIGKYNIKDKNIIKILKDNISFELNSLIQQGNNKNFIEDNYNLRVNDYFLLFCCSILFRMNIGTSTKLLISQYITMHSKNSKLINECYNFIINIAENFDKNNTIQAMNAADILLLTNNSRYMSIAKKTLEKLRIIEGKNPVVIKSLSQIIQDRRQDRRQDIPELNTIRPLQQNDNFIAGIPLKLERTIYEDSQNVHNSTINNRTLEIAKQLQENESNSEFDYKLLEGLSDDKIKKINTSIHRIMTDSTKFGGGNGNGNISLHNTFTSIISKINGVEDEEIKMQLNKRMLEELFEMSGLCATGHLSRLTNITSGFEDVLNQKKVLIKPEEEIYSKFSRKIQKTIEQDENSDELIDLLAFDKNNKKIQDIIEKTITDLNEELLKEYNGILNKDSIVLELTKSKNKLLGK